MRQPLNTTPIAPRLVIPTSFEECLTYGEQVAFIWQKVQEIDRRVRAMENRSQNLDTDDGR